MRILRLAGAFGAALAAAPCFAGPPMLDFPLDCTLGESCFIDDYVDADPGEGLRDYTCGIKTRDGHRGTDFILPHFDDMARGVDVLAAAPGRVDALRDGMADEAITPDTRSAIEGRECGNAVRIDHGDGWQTLYCHMKRTSIIVRKGQAVQAWRRAGPGGPERTDQCAAFAFDGAEGWPGGRSVPARGRRLRHRSGQWPLARCAGLRSGGPLYSAGFSTAMPDFDAVASGAARVRVSTPDQPLILYGFVHLARPGDTLSLTVSGPEGEVFEETVVLEDPEKRLFRAFGRKSPAGGWQEGPYRGYVTLSRDGRIIAVRHADIDVSAASIAPAVRARSGATHPQGTSR